MTTLRAVGAGDLEGALSELIGAEAFEGLCAAGLTLGELNALFAGSGASAG